MIEYVLAHGMGLQIGRRGGGETAPRVLDKNMRADPAGSRTNRLRRLKRRQERMGYKRVKPLRFICWLVSVACVPWSRREHAKSTRVRLRIGASVPLRGIDLAHRLRDMGRVGQRHRGTPGRNRLLAYRDRLEQTRQRDPGRGKALISPQSFPKPRPFARRAIAILRPRWPACGGKPAARTCVELAPRGCSARRSEA